MTIRDLVWVSPAAIARGGEVHEEGAAAGGVDVRACPRRYNFHSPCLCAEIRQLKGLRVPERKVHWTWLHGPVKV